MYWVQGQAPKRRGHKSLAFFAVFGLFKQKHETQQFLPEIIDIPIPTTMEDTLLLHISVLPFSDINIQTYLHSDPPIIDCQIMGNCVKSLQPKEELKRTAHYQNKPLDNKTAQGDYQFLKYPTIFKEEASNIKKEDSAANPKVIRHILKTDDKESIKENTSPNMLSDNPIRNPLSADDQDNEMLNPYNTKSAIIKLSKKASLGKKKSENDPDNRPQPPKESETIDAVLTNQPVASSLIFTHGDVDMEFSLSRCRAGPLTVPYLLYDNYNTS